MNLWFASVDPTLPAPWRSVMDESGGLAFYWNPETDHSFPSSDCNYRPPDYPTSYKPELPVALSCTSPIFLPHPTPPSRKAPSVSFSQRRYQNPLILSFSATPSLLSIRSSQAQEPTSPTRMGARMPIALQRGRGAETVASCTIRSSLTTQEEDDESVRSQMGPTSSRS
ncbi:leucine-rich repeat extensin-like protein 6 [Pyrus ussuriensis x Pyrus communis]|uniref:Leucine-rich repeat extensin-like protein 6 n=1 Tax=Pyrus ussuriensis x Pyrus communis TaxID=2448454 RepID=A0A5N5F1U6_9ROSA|nr:leucine-rich repeat extensin-like protein 6 [Pyrus ussuriensis x Pyrus communis]